MYQKTCFYTAVGVKQQKKLRIDRLQQDKTEMQFDK